MKNIHSLPSKGFLLQEIWQQLNAHSAFFLSTALFYEPRKYDKIRKGKKRRDVSPQPQRPLFNGRRRQSSFASQAQAGPRLGLSKVRHVTAALSLVRQRLVRLGAPFRGNRSTPPGTPTRSSGFGRGAAGGGGWGWRVVAGVAVLVESSLRSASSSPSSASEFSPSSLVTSRPSTGDHPPSRVAPSHPQPPTPSDLRE